MNTLTLKIDLRLIVLGLLAVIAVMLALWRPWTNVGETRTIAVTGQGNLQVAPNQFTFTPVYQETSTSQAEAQKAVTDKGNSVVAKLKELGVSDQDIATNVSTNEDYRKIAPVPPSDGPTGFQATYSLTVKANNKEQAQKVLDYLATTTPLYSLTPQSGLTKERQQQLELDARKKALQNAKEKAQQSATELGLKLGKVSKVSDLTQTGGGIPISYRDSAKPEPTRSTDTTSPTLQTGEQEVSFNLTVEFEMQ
jgi:uncharacterized protein YggE